VAARVDQHSALTVEASMEQVSADQPCVMLGLFSQNQQAPFGHRGVYASFMDDDDEFDLGTSNQGKANELVSKDLDPSVRKMVVRLAYDPESGIARYWMGRTLLGECRIPTQPREGKYVLFGTYYPCKVKYIRMTGGASLPDASRSAGGPKAAHLVQMANQDRSSASQVLLQDKLFRFDTETFGTVQCQSDRVRRILFRNKGIERPRRQKGDVLVQTHSGRLTLQLQTLDASALKGKSDYLGEIAIRRSSIRTIRFNIYREGLIDGSAQAPLPPPALNLDPFAPLAPNKRGPAEAVEVPADF
jgi:hypothetical protein